MREREYRRKGEWVRDVVGVLLVGWWMLTASLLCAEEMPEVRQGDVLDLHQCVAIALERHPQVKASRANVKVYESKVEQSKAGYYPQVNFSTGYSNTKATSMPDVTGKSFKEYIGTTTLKQTLYDFGRTSSQVDVQKRQVDASLFDADDVVAQTVFRVKESYYSLLRAKKNREVAMEVVKQYEIHLAQAKALYEVGTKPKIDVTKAEVDLSNAQLNLIKAENSLKLAKVTLDNAMGIPDAPEYDVQDTLTADMPSVRVEEALQKAYEQRDDLKSARARLTAAKRSVDLARKDFFPSLGAKVTYSIPRNGDASGDDWDVALTFSVPIFSGFSTTYKVQESKANVEVLRAQEESLRQRIYLEVKQAYLNMEEAKERVKTAAIAVKQAQENLQLARERYAVGSGSSIEITDSVVTYARSNVEYIQALYDYKIAEASLARAMGVRE